jgi:regulator of protease activity HflC (stomatin/prohibitin superfamily)
MNESKIVTQAVKRGVVMACAQISIDDLLRQGEERGESLSTRIKSFAQEALDTGGTGISVERVSMTIQTPPISTREAFSKVQASVSDAQKFIENARKDATKALNDAAGAASGPIIERINAYELAIDQRDKALQDRTLAEIETMLKGPSFEHEGRVVQVSGNAAKIISEAELYRTRAVSKSRSDAARFRAKLEQFGRNPLVVMENEWSQARQVFIDRSTTTQMLLPPAGAGDLLVLRLNRDPSWLRDMEKRVKQDEMRRAEREQMEQLRREGLKTEVKSETQTQ